MKNRILKLVCVFVVIAVNLHAQPFFCGRNEVGDFECPAVDSNNIEQVIEEIRVFYEDKYEYWLTALPYVEIESEIEGFMETLLSNSAFNTGCKQGKPIKLGSILSTEGDEGSYDIFFRWDDNLPHDPIFYSAYLDFSDAEIDSVYQDSPRMILNVPGRVTEKLYVLNARCDEGQSSYYIVIIDKNLLQATENSDTESEDENVTSSETRLKTFPNPVNGEAMNIDIYLPQEQQASISLIEGSTGKQLKTIISKAVFPKGHSSQSIDLSELASGVYYLVLQTEEERITKKIIKI